MTLADRRIEIATGLTRKNGVERALARIADPKGQGAKAFLAPAAEDPLARADAMDRAAKAGEKLPVNAGLIVSIKDLFDVAGEVTRSGSVLLNDAAPATRDADAVRRLKEAGFISIGRTNMTEFAFSGLGINPHYGTPLNPYDRATGRIPGGSSSGAAVSVTDGMADVALGTDTGGSCRIPAALCGLVGFKPTAKRVSLDGVMPLSPTLDSVGSLGRSVACCATVDAVISSDGGGTAEVRGPLNLGVLTNYVNDGIDDQTARSFENALSRLSAKGIKITPIAISEIDEIPGINSKGGFAAREAYLYHKQWMESRGDAYDPRVIVRIMKGEAQSDADYAILQKARASLCDRVAEKTKAFDALVMPTVPRIAPTLQELASDEDYGRINLLMLRNPTVANMLDRCAISLPCHEADQPPVGLMLMGEHGADAKLFGIAAQIEALLGTPGR
jgi:aspartyl-tRNA(Asn)/glutamyl-tRNA(Gln) amidotransferase subunit A